MTVTAAAPEEVRVTDCVPVEPTATLPNESEVALMVSAGEPVAGEMVMSKYSVTPPAWAVMVAFWVIATLATAALNAALIAPAFTVTPLGTVTYGSLLDSDTLTAALAAAVRFTEQTSVAAELYALLTHEMLLSAGDAEVAGFNWSDTDLEVLAAVAVRVADCALVTEATLAVKAALVAVAGTVTEPGIVTALLVLPRLTLMPPVGAAPDRLTVQASASDPVMDVLLQDTVLTVGKTAVPVPLRLTVAVGALLEIVT